MKILGIKVVDGIEEYYKDIDFLYVCVIWKEKYYNKGYIYYVFLKGKFVILLFEGKIKEDKVSV